MGSNALQPIYDYLAPDENADYGQILPFAKDRATGDVRWSMPEGVRNALLGIVDLARSTETGSLTGNALASLTLGGMGAGGMMAPRGAIAAGGAKPIRAYHGSPHSFDRFDSSKIGTGEGAQAYGHGLYFAENEGVARSYRDALSTKIIGGKPTDWTTPEDIAAGWLKIFKGDVNKAASYLEGVPKDYQTPAGQQAAEMLRSGVQLPEVSPGHMYEVDIHADPERFLDWDKPLSGQSPYVRAFFDRQFQESQTAGNLTPYWAREYPRGELSGGSLYKSATDAMTNVPVESAKVLSQSGIPGIRYLDQGSRGAGQGSYNYVVFPNQDEIIQILRKYGLAAPSPVVPAASGNALRDLPNSLRKFEDREY